MANPARWAARDLQIDILQHTMGHRTAVSARCAADFTFYLQRHAWRGRTLHVGLVGIFKFVCFSMQSGTAQQRLHDAKRFEVQCQSAVQKTRSMITRDAEDSSREEASVGDEIVLAGQKPVRGQVWITYLALASALKGHLRARADDKRCNTSSEHRACYFLPLHSHNEATTMITNDATKCSCKAIGHLMRLPEAHGRAEHDDLV